MNSLHHSSHAISEFVLVLESLSTTPVLSVLGLPWSHFLSFICTVYNPGAASVTIPILLRPCSSRWLSPIQGFGGNSSPFPNLGLLGDGVGAGSWEMRIKWTSTIRCWARTWKIIRKPDPQAGQQIVRLAGQLSPEIPLPNVSGQPSLL